MTANFGISKRILDIVAAHPEGLSTLQMSDILFAQGVTHTRQQITTWVAALHAKRRQLTAEPRFCPRAGRVQKIYALSRQEKINRRAYGSYAEAKS